MLRLCVCVCLCLFDGVCGINTCTTTPQPKVDPDIWTGIASLPNGAVVLGADEGRCLLDATLLRASAFEVDKGK